MARQTKEVINSLKNNVAEQDESIDALILFLPKIAMLTLQLSETISKLLEVVVKKNNTYKLSICITNLLKLFQYQQEH